MSEGTFLFAIGVLALGAGGVILAIKIHMQASGILNAWATLLSIVIMAFGIVIAAGPLFIKLGEMSERSLTQITGEEHVQTIWTSIAGAYKDVANFLGADSDGVPAPSNDKQSPYQTPVPGSGQSPGSPGGSTTGDCPSCQDVIDGYRAVYDIEGKPDFWGEVVADGLDWMQKKIWDGKRCPNFCTAAVQELGDVGSSADAAEYLLDKDPAVAAQIGWPGATESPSQEPGAEGEEGAAPPPPSVPTPDPAQRALEDEFRAVLDPLWESGNRTKGMEVAKDPKYRDLQIAVETRYAIEVADDQVKDWEAIFGDEPIEKKETPPSGDVLSYIPTGEEYKVVGVVSHGAKLSEEAWSIQVISPGWLRGERIHNINGHVMKDMDPATRKVGHIFWWHGR